MNQTIESPKWWRYLARFLLIGTIGVVVFSLFSFWAAKSEFIGKYDLAYAIRFGFYFLFSWYASLGIILMAVVGLVIGIILKYSLKNYMIMAVISLLPTVFFAIFR